MLPTGNKCSTRPVSLRIAARANRRRVWDAHALIAEPAAAAGHAGQSATDRQAASPLPASLAGIRNAPPLGLSLALSQIQVGGSQTLPPSKALEQSTKNTLSALLWNRQKPSTRRGKNSSPASPCPRRNIASPKSAAAVFALAKSAVRREKRTRCARATRHTPIARRTGRRKTYIHTRKHTHTHQHLTHAVHAHTHAARLLKKGKTKRKAQKAKQKASGRRRDPAAPPRSPLNKAQRQTPRHPARRARARHGQPPNQPHRRERASDRSHTAPPAMAAAGGGDGGDVAGSPSYGAAPLHCPPSAML